MSQAQQRPVSEYKVTPAAKSSRLDIKRPQFLPISEMFVRCVSQMGKGMVKMYELTLVINFLTHPKASHWNLLHRRL